MASAFVHVKAVRNNVRCVCKCATDVAVFNNRLCNQIVGAIKPCPGCAWIEAGTEIEKIAPALKALGHDVRPVELNSGTQGIIVTPDGLAGGADRRREGVALGD